MKGDSTTLIMLQIKIQRRIKKLLIIFFFLGSGLWANAFEVNAPFLSITDEQFDFLKPEWDAFLGMVQPYVKHIHIVRELMWCAINR